MTEKDYEQLANVAYYKAILDGILSTLNEVGDYSDYSRVSEQIDTAITALQSASDILGGKAQDWIDAHNG